MLKLQVHLSTGNVLDMEYGEHAEDHFWTVNYTVTPDTPTGQLDYFVTAIASCIQKRNTAHLMLHHH